MSVFYMKKHIPEAIPTINLPLRSIQMFVDKEYITFPTIMSIRVKDSTSFVVLLSPQAPNNGDARNDPALLTATAHPRIDFSPPNYKT
jgi:hypothetical protein